VEAVFNEVSAAQSGWGTPSLERVLEYKLAERRTEATRVVSSR
jgi:hypothetical protein